jgi:hypothetical protein
MRVRLICLVALAFSFAGAVADAQTLWTYYRLVFRPASGSNTTRRIQDKLGQPALVQIYLVLDLSSF